MLGHTNLDLWGEFVEALLPFFGGLYITLVGYRVLGKKPGQNPAYDAHMRKWGRWWRVGGLVLMAGSLLLGGLRVWILWR